MSALKSSHGEDLPASVKGKAQKIEYYHFNTPVQIVAVLLRLGVGF